MTAGARGRRGFFWFTAPGVRRQAFYQGSMVAAFSLFWTGSPLMLAREFGMGLRGISLFALAGAVGALVSPLAGRLAARGPARVASGISLAITVFAFVLSVAAVQERSVTLLVAAAVMLGGSVQVSQVLSLRSLYTLVPAQRGRVTALLIPFMLICGALGSVLAAVLYLSDGWVELATVGALLGVAALIVYSTELVPSRRRAVS